MIAIFIHKVFKGAPRGAALRTWLSCVNRQPGAAAPQNFRRSPLRTMAFWVGLTAAAMQAHADERIYRCGNEYTNTVTEAQAKTCKLLSGGNVTVIQSPPRQAAVPAPVRQASGQRIDSVDQRARDSDARMILESELKKAEANKRH